MIGNNFFAFMAAGHTMVNSNAKSNDFTKSEILNAARRELEHYGVLKGKNLFDVCNHIEQKQFDEAYSIMYDAVIDYNFDAYIEERKHQNFNKQMSAAFAF